MFGIVLPHFIGHRHEFLDSMKQFMKSCHYVGTNGIIFGVFVALFGMDYHYYRRVCLLYSDNYLI